MNILLDLARWAVAYLVSSVILPLKEELSRDIALKTPQRPVAVLGKARDNGQVSLSLINEINRQCARLPYKLDPLGGLKDYYTHPQTVQYSIENGTRTVPYDCDDLAVYAHALAEAASVEKRLSR